MATASEVGIVIRDLLDSLPRGALLHLCERCNILPDSDKLLRSLLDRVYLRNLGGFLADLREEDLLVLISDHFTDVRNDQIRPKRDAASLSAEELRQVLLEYLEKGIVPLEFELEVVRDPKDEVFDEDQDSADNQDSDKDQEDFRNREASGGREPGPKFGGGPFDTLTVNWSRPRKIARVFAMLGEAAPVPLFEARFQGLIDRLGRMGIEVTLADKDGRPFLPGSARPSSDDKIRLRRNMTASVGRSEMLQAPERGVVHIGRAPGFLKPVPPPRRDGWELAVIRLRFLTAVPIADRRLQANWPHGFVEASLQGLSLPEPKKRLLATASQQFVTGNHDACELIPDVLALHSREECAALFDHFRRLNACARDYVEQIIQLVYERLGHPSPSVVRPAAPPMPSSGRVAIVGVECTDQNRAHPSIPAAPVAKPSQNDSGEGKNVRRLGMLADLFKTKG